MGIEPETVLAMSLSTHKGAYALLLGSGVSRSAGIPTGWEILQDLIRRVARLEGADAGPSPEAWYSGRFGRAANYSELVTHLAPQPSERMSLLRSYFEATEEDRESGRKLPTAAHFAIARLAASGTVRVVITTNFDRLLERAMESEGVIPTVVATDDQIKGMLPLPHVQCLVFKVHGDYLDTRIRNTPEELANYDPDTSALLDRILADFGLLVCGWSGMWDAALADAIARNNHFKFSTYWMARGEPTGRARDLISHRNAMIVPIESADVALGSLESKVDALTAGRAASPISPQIAVSTMKRFLSEPRFRIQLEDLVTRELLGVVAATSLHAMPLGDPPPEKAIFVDRVARIEVSCEKLAPMVATGVYWDRGRLDALWCRCVESLAREQQHSGTSFEAWTHLRYFPSTVVLYSAGIAGLLRGRLKFVRRLLMDTKFRSYSKSDSESLISRTTSEFSIPKAPGQYLHERDGQPSTLKTPGSDWMVRRLSEMLTDALPSDTPFEEIFDEFEFIVALTTADVLQECHVGRFYWHDPRRIFASVGSPSKPNRRAVELLSAGFFGGTLDRFNAALKMTEERCGLRGRHWE